MTMPSTFKWIDSDSESLTSQNTSEISPNEKTSSMPSSFKLDEPKVSESYVKWIEKKSETFSEEYPILCWSSVAVIAIFCVWLLIKCAWKLTKLVIYQTVYTISKAIKDGSR
jgi:hypothetical protein